MIIVLFSIINEEIRIVKKPSNIYNFFSNLMALTKLSYFLALTFKNS